VADGPYAYTSGNLSAGTNYSLSLSTATPLATFAITPKAVVITPTAGQGKISGTNDPTFSFSNDGGLLAAAFGTTKLGRIAGENVGTYAYTLGSLSAGPNYNLTLTTPVGTFQIYPVPVVTVKAPDPAAIGTSSIVRASYNPGDIITINNVPQASWVWQFNNNGTTVTTITPLEPGKLSISGSNSHTSVGVYTVFLRYRNAIGQYQETAPVYVVFYDPSAGFVTGGVTINSNEGAFALDARLTGKANAGFVSKYTKGQTVPTGETEFEFQVGGMKFQSTSYDWLVVSGATAKYKGKGTVTLPNGRVLNNCGFLLAATDGAVLGGTNPDRFRIKIWEITSTGDKLVYDNQVTKNADGTFSYDADNADATTAIATGSIVIHQPSTKATTTKERVATEAEIFTGTEAATLTSYPNPFTNQATIEFALDTDEEYNLMVYSVRGSLVKALKSGKAQAKTPVKVQWGDATTPAGVYIVRLTTKTGVKTLRIVKD
ncbi:MAG: T9SS type A sorting domain-containing protein, partial [Adhaeribacter sp.]